MYVPELAQRVGARMRLPYSPIIFILVLLSPGPLLLASALPQNLPTITQLLNIPPPSWFENLVQRPNGDVLVTELSSPRLWTVNPYAKNPNASAEIIAELPGYLGLLGIDRVRSIGKTGRHETTIQGEEYVFVAGNFSLGLPGQGPVGSTPGSYSIFSLIFPTPYNGPGEATSPQIKKLSDLPRASFLNGLAHLPNTPYVLIADSTLGLVFRFNLLNLKLDVAVDDPLMKKCNSSVLEGINGLKYRPNASGEGGKIFWTNAYCGFFASIAVDPSTGKQVEGATSRIISYPGLFMDDFDLSTHSSGSYSATIKERSTAYLAGGQQNEIFAISLPGGRLDIAAGAQNSSSIAEPTGVRIGMTEEDKIKARIYVSTGGGLAGTLPGVVGGIGGQIVAVDFCNP